ncbi:MAG: YopX family protein [Phycisphaerae bacterium]|nr:YopX family protein [Phycisphaerae bacterium]
MRTIRFRGRRKDNGEWVYGFYCIVRGQCFIIPDDAAIEGNDFTPDACIVGFVEVDPATVGQFTGLLDNTKWEELTESERGAWTRNGNMPSEWHGREVYEGDVLQGDGKQPFHRPDRFVIEWESSGDAIYEWTGYPINKSSAKHYKIIGNCLENPELLK